MPRQIGVIDLQHGEYPEQVLCSGADPDRASNGHVPRPSILFYPLDEVTICSALMK
jgi:hypothetical protein